MALNGSKTICPGWNAEEGFLPFVTTPGLNESIGGAILFDETIRQQTKEGIPFVDILTKAGIIPGIKVDMGAKPMAGFAGEKITDGLDGLRDRLEDYKKMGEKWPKIKYCWSV
ncbi:MAG: class I fructose-bisphosphate aldolase [Ferruginibacter sp.]